MLCRKFGSRNGSNEEKMGSVPVYLNVYDLTPINGYAYWLGLGVYHSGVQVDLVSVVHWKEYIPALKNNEKKVHGIEYAFGAHEHSTTGIFEGEPKQCDGFTFRKTILIGQTDMEPAQVRAVMEELAEQYKGNAYNLITKNCNHFCNDACIRLTGNPIPSWVNRLARIGFMCNCVLPMTLNSTKVRHHRIEDNSKKPLDGEKKKVTSEPNGPPSSNSSCSASSSPSTTTMRRGRSRTRRPLPPSSPLIVGSSAS